ncbi:hypothetical protein EON65_03795 [archaeon]|nr:MAG: hypothetical protein EON65_03795 [archaeon]
MDYPITQAIGKTAAARLEHSYQEWRHVTLMPIVQGGRLVRLSPLLIDFCVTQVHDSAESAEIAMMRRVAQLQKGHGLE